MKNNFIFVVAIFGASLLMFGCKQATPEVVKSSFKQNFPTVSNVNWSQEDNEWEAEFKSGDRAASASFTADGKLIEQEISLQMAELPAPAQKSLNGQKVKEIVKATKADGSVCYEVEVGKKEIQFDSTGKLINSPQKDKEAKD